MESNISFNQADQTDVEAIFSFCKDLIDCYEDCAMIEYDSVLTWIKNKIRDNIHAYICIYFKGVKVGYYHLISHENATELDDFFIYPEFRSKGIGTYVLEKCMRESKCPIFLYVFRQNIGAIRLYERMGFRLSEAVGSTRLIMRYLG